MKVESIGFKNPFYKSGYTNNIKINNLNDINVFVGKNNSGKTNVLKSLYNLLHQDIERSGIFRRIKVKLDNKDFQSIIENFHKILLKMFKNRDKADYEGVPIERFYDQEFVNQFYPLFNSIKDFPISNKSSFVFNFNNDIPNKKLLFDYNVGNNDLNEQVQNSIEEILAKVKKDQNLIKILLKQILTFRRVILIPSFRTLEISEKKYQDTEIREINSSIKTILESSFNSLPINNPRSKPFKIPNLALILSMVKEDQLIGVQKELMNPDFFDFFDSSLRQIFPEINVSIEFKLTELTTKGGYQEFGKFLGDWQKLGHGTQQLISLLFLLVLPKDCVYIIDEPENSLHPGLQLKLLKFIKEIVLKDSIYSKQFFFATHSTSFIDFRGNCSHFVCEKTENKFSVELLEEENLNTIREVLGLNPGTLLQANGIIWVEGPSERFYLKMLFNCFDVNLDYRDVLIMSYNGKDYIIKEYISLDLLIKINPNFIVIMDSDKKGSEAGFGIDQSKLNIREKYLNAGKKFWLIGKYCDIEGIIPQDVLNEYFKINLPLTNEKLKGNYQKLDVYIEEMKRQGLTAENSPNYRDNKVRDSEKISDLILAKNEYKQLIRANPYLKEKFLELNKEITEWIERSSTKLIRSENFDNISNVRKPSKIQMMEALAKFSNTDLPEVRNEISANFIYWGSRGTQFLLDEHRTNRYGYSDTSGVVMDMSYPNWREQEKFSTKIKNSTQLYYCSNCKNSITIDPSIENCPICGFKFR